MSRMADEAGPSQSLKAQLALRALLVEGALAPGERVSELQMVERLGVSRTPVRAALARLEEEGLLEALPNGGFAAKAFSEREAFQAIEIRGTLEGLAARLAAETGITAAEERRAASCLDRIDAILAGDDDRAGDLDVAAYVAANAGFHGLLVGFSGSAALVRQIERASALPFASASAMVPAQSRAPDSRRILVTAQDQHRCALDAIARREGARAEAIMREHARIARRNLARALGDARDLALVPGGGLIRRAG